MEMLHQFYEEKRYELHSYVQKPDAKDFVIKKKNEDLAVLYKILGLFQKVEYNEFWTCIDKEVQQMLKKDSEIGYVCVLLHLKNGKGNLGKIDGNYYKS